MRAQVSYVLLYKSISNLVFHYCLVCCYLFLVGRSDVARVVCSFGLRKVHSHCSISVQRASLACIDEVSLITQSSLRVMSTGLEMPA